MPTDPNTNPPENPTNTNPAESTPAPADPTPAETTPPKRKSPSPINRKYLAEIELIRDLVPQAQKPERATDLAEGGWDAAHITALSAAADTLEQAALNAVGRTQSRVMDTAEEGDARTKLLAALHPIRAGAKRKYRRGPDAAAGRATYFVNQETNVSLGRLLFIAGSVLQKLVPQPPAATPEDTLPGVSSEKLTALENLREAYRAADADQQEMESAKGQAHVDVVTAYTAAHNQRIDLQLAADQAWTYHNPANAAIRRDFKIPPDRAAVE